MTTSASKFRSIFTSLGRMFASFRRLAIVSAIVLSVCSIKIYAEEPRSIDDQARDISYLLFCPVCQGQTVEESNSNLAKDMRGIIKTKLLEGQTKDEIIGYFVKSYGESILASPPAKGVSWLLWLAPGFLLALGAAAIGVFLLRTKGAKQEPKRPVAKVSPEYLEKIEKELKNFDS